MESIMAMLLSFYLIHTPHPEPHFVAALRYLGNQEVGCSPMGMKYEDVKANVGAILAGKGHKCPAIS